MKSSAKVYALTRLVLRVGGGVSLLTAAGLAAALALSAAIATNLDGNFFGIPMAIEGIAREQVLLFAALCITSALICVILVYCTFRTTAPIIESAIHGDPFDDTNANRLARIGWLILVMQGIGTLTDLTIVRAAPDAIRDQLNTGFQLSPVGLLAALLIFALSQVFRHGSSLRSDLEGTV